MQRYKVYICIKYVNLYYDCINNYIIRKCTRIGNLYTDTHIFMTVMTELNLNQNTTGK